MLWLEPHLLNPNKSSAAFSHVSRALGEQGSSRGLRKIFGKNEEYIIKRMADGIPMTEIAKELDIAVGSIYNWKARNKKNTMS